MAENFDWLYDYLLQFLKSPGWRVPILNFIDQYCYQFEDNADNKLVYTEIHNKFKELIDQLLENLCITLGITQEQFLKVCEQGIKNPAHKRVFEQMFACDNFISFKKLMLKRNKELEAEAAKHVEKKPVVSKEETEVELARSISLKEAEDRKRLEDKYNEELRLAMKLSEEEFKTHLVAVSEVEKAEQRKKEIFKQAEEREQARLNALKEEAEKVLKQKLEEEQRLEAIRQEEAKIKKLIEDKKNENSAGLKEKELQVQIKEAEAERLKKEAEAQRLQNEQKELLKKIQEAEEKRKIEEQQIQESLKRKEEKKKEQERIRLIEEEKKRKDEEEKNKWIEEQRLSIIQEERKIELEKLRLKEEAKRIEEERLQFEALKQEKERKRAEKTRLKEEQKRKEEEERLKTLEAEERKKIEEENLRIQRLQRENEKLNQLLVEKKEQKKKKREEVKVDFTPEPALPAQTSEKDLPSDPKPEVQVKKTQEGSSEYKGKSSLPPINVKMGIMTGIPLPSEEQVSERKGPETLAEREARLKLQRDQLLAAKRKQREEAFKEYIKDGGTDLNKKATPAANSEEIEKRKQVLMKIKTYNEENEA